MKFHVAVDNAPESFNIEIPTNCHILLYLQYWLYSELRNPYYLKNRFDKFPKSEILTNRSWGIEFSHRGRVMYDVFEEYVTGTIENQVYHQNEYLVYRIG